MKTKTSKTLFKMAVALMGVMLAFILTGRTPVEAKYDNTVRVSTQKELNAALKNPDAEVIILRTQAYIVLKIKKVSATKEKFLIIDTPNALVNNYSVFSEISIENVGNYVENVSGNKISLSADAVRGSFVVEKGKKLKSLEIQSYYGDLFAKYVIREGAKIQEISYVYGGGNAPVESTYNKSKRTLSLKFTDSDSCTRAYTVKLDKSGRVSRIKCKSNWVEYTFDYKYTYNNDGRVTKLTGKDNESGEFTDTFTYSDGLKVKEVYTDSFRSGEWNMTYNDQRLVSKAVYTGKDQMDGQTFDVKCTYEYKYDDYRNQIYFRNNDDKNDNFTEYNYEYNKKHFLVKSIGNLSGSETVYTFTYNKRGDLTKYTATNEGNTETYTYKYDTMGTRLE